jgi:glycosyltransferase involved in cell wall biosynthesis
MKSGATESSFYYLSQYLNIPQEVHISRSSQELLFSSKKYKILWAHDNCDQPIHANLPEVVSQIDKIVCVSNWEREQYIKYNRAPAEKLIVIPNGVNDMFRPLENSKSKTCIFFSAPHKGIIPLSKIWRQVIKQHPDATLKVFSSGDLYSQYQNLPEFSQAIEELQSLPNVLYSSCIDREDLLSHIQDAAFFIHPNVWEETFCVSLAEAMCCGCYPITTDMGALSETSFGRGKYVPMSGENTSRGWVPDDTFISNFSQEVINALHFFDKEPETFYKATNELSILTRNTYDWKQIAQDWNKLLTINKL